MKAGIIGIGHWGTKVAREYIALHKERVIDSVMLCDLDSSKLKLFKDSVQTSNSVNDILDKVDMVHICTPNFTHYELVKKALESGLNVVVEKPMAEDVSQSFDLVELSLSKGLILQVGHIFRFANIVKRIKQLVELKYLGDIYYFNISWTHLMPPMRNVDVIYDLLPHPLDILNFITGKWPVGFGGIGKSCRRDHLVEVANLDLVYPKFYASVYLSWLSPERRRRLEVVGSKKSIIADCAKQTGQIFSASGSEDISVEVNNTIRDEILNFVDSIRTGKNSQNSSIIGARTIETINQIVKSIKYCGEIA